ncbi:MAG: hypothetical protein CVU00_13290 [Bacteroidetes bacterium HGW-Bacteroidetes-17]|nr:MAG: hypothetical protein CVU00_13290 [Bacteroidetes bacterium HGW-Bacteroidetes-17]
MFTNFAQFNKGRKYSLMVKKLILTQIYTIFIYFDLNFNNMLMHCFSDTYTLFIYRGFLNSPISSNNFYFKMMESGIFVTNS